MNDIFPKKGVSGIGSDLSRALVAAKLAGGVMVIDRNFRVVMIDRKAAEFCRVSSGQSQGKRFYALFTSLMGSALSGELHDVFGTACTKRWTRPADNKLLDQFVDAFGRERAALISISLEAFEDPSNTYALIKLALQKTAVPSVDEDLKKDQYCCALRRHRHPQHPKRCWWMTALHTLLLISAESYPLPVTRPSAFLPTRRNCLRVALCACFFRGWMKWTVWI